MCGRFTLKTPAATISTLFPAINVPSLKPRYNIAPTQMVTCVRMDSGREFDVVSLKWGLIPFWSKDTKLAAKMINARSETVSEKPAFRNAYKKRRCLVVADGYYEWKKLNGAKQPFYFTPTQESDAFCMAGLWEKWDDKSTGESVESCTVLTTDANTKLSEFHHRMPVVIEPDDFEFWLDHEFQSEKKLESLFAPKPESFFQVRPVSPKVNHVKNDSDECIREIELN